MHVPGSSDAIEKSLVSLSWMTERLWLNFHSTWSWPYYWVPDNGMWVEPLINLKEPPHTVLIGQPPEMQDTCEVHQDKWAKELK